MNGKSHRLSQFVIKVHGWCDLSCDHCYVYEGADQSWRLKSKSMSLDAVKAAAARIAEHAAAWHLPVVRVILHGGEPLLLGAERMRDVLEAFHAGITPVTRLELIMQSNGVRLDETMADVLKDYGVRVGISLDGDRAANDRHRRYANGASSYDKVRAGLVLLRTPRYRELYGGILCTIDVRNPPLDVYRALLAERPPRIDFLLPHATWDDPPFRPDDDPAPYATWLTAIYDQWLADGRPMRIRIFDSIRSTATGGPSGSEQLGTDPADLVVIDTDGQYEQADSIKVTYAGAPETGLTIWKHTVDEVSQLQPVALRQAGVAGLSDTCRACPVVNQCGGGLYAHRYRTGSGFDNPSAYCADLFTLIERINTATAVQASAAGPEAMPADLVDQIAAGFGDEATMQWLVEAELNITRALLRGVIDTGGDPHAWDVLTGVEAESPEAVRHVLAHPYVRVWAVDHLKGTSGPSYLGELAASAAIHAGLSAETDVSIRDGRIHLPTIGTIYWPGGTDRPVRLTVGSGVIKVAGPGTSLTMRLDGDDRPAWWQQTRSVQFDGWNLVLDDGDPHRACHKWTPSSRLDGRSEDVWRESLTDAWRIILDEVPGYAPGLRAGLRTVVPLEADPAGLMRASTARNAFGSVAAAHADPASLAVMLVHEFQHGKLGALLDLCDLFDVHSPTMLQVGWRPEPRPIEGVLQGVYAHAAVADIWRVRTERDGGAAARESYRRYRDWTTDAVERLQETDALTTLGQRFLGRLATSIVGWPA